MVKLPLKILMDILLEEKTKQMKNQFYQLIARNGNTLKLFQFIQSTIIQQENISILKLISDFIQVVEIRQIKLYALLLNQKNGKFLQLKNMAINTPLNKLLVISIQVVTKMSIKPSYYLLTAKNGNNLIQQIYLMVELD